MRSELNSRCALRKSATVHVILAGEAEVLRNPKSASGAVRGVVLGTLTSASIATALISADVAEASCTMVRGTGDEARCASDPTNFAERLDEKSSVSAQGRLGGPRANVGRGDGVSPAPTLSPSAGNSDTGRAAGDAVTVAESMLGTDMFGDYGCEDFVDAAYGLTTETGMGHDAALAFYQSMADRGLDHHETPIPRGALVFSAGPDGNHVDISRGDGTYVSGGVQGISPGYGDGHNVQILPAPNLGAWTMYGWVYAPW